VHWSSHWRGGELYTAIKLHYQGREEEALAYLWGLWEALDEGDKRDVAYTHLKALETVILADAIIERNKRGVTNG